MSIVRDCLKKGIKTSSDASRLLIGLMEDTVDGELDVATAGVISKSIAHLLNIKKLEVQIGRDAFAFSSSLTETKPQITQTSGDPDKRVKCNQCESVLLPKDLGEHKRTAHPITLSES